MTFAHLHTEFTCLDFPLSDEPNFGTWRIQANVQIPDEEGDCRVFYSTPSATCTFKVEEFGELTSLESWRRPPSSCGLWLARGRVRYERFMLRGLELWAGVISRATFMGL